MVHRFFEVHLVSVRFDGAFGIKCVLWAQFGLLRFNMVCTGSLGLNGVLWVQCGLLFFGGLNGVLWVSMGFCVVLGVFFK